MSCGRFLTALRGLSLAALLPAGTAAQAHEAWLLTPIEIAAAISSPPPPLFTSTSPLAFALSLAMGSAVLVGAAFDRRLAPWQDRMVARITNQPMVVAALICQAGLAVLMLTAALGLAPRHGSDAYANPTLFAGDLELARLGFPAEPLLIALQVTLALMLATGVFVRIAGLLVMVLVGIAYVAYGADVHPYAGHLLAPAMLVALYAQGWGDDQRPCALPIGDGSVMALFRLLVGGTFIYLAIVFKVQNVNLIIAILDSGQIPTFGTPHDIVAYAMALVELLIGVLIVFGIAVRPAGIAVLGAMAFFAVTLKEAPHIHANIIASVIVLILFGQTGVARADASVADTRLRFLRLRDLHPQLASPQRPAEPCAPERLAYLRLRDLHPQMGRLP